MSLDSTVAAPPPHQDSLQKLHMCCPTVHFFPSAFRRKASRIQNRAVRSSNRITSAKVPMVHFFPHRFTATANQNVAKVAHVHHSKSETSRIDAYINQILPRKSIFLKIF